MGAAARFISLSFAALASAVLVSQAARAVSITEFPLPHPSSGPWSITSGPDGNLWFTENANNVIGRITPSGDITEFGLPAGGSPTGITSGPDGNVWFTESSQNRIGSITPSGTFTEFPIPTPGSGPIGIVSGPDGNLWFAGQGGRIGRLTTAGVFTEFTVPTDVCQPFGIASGPDGNLWFTERLGNKIGRITTTGTITEFSIPTADSWPEGICLGPDGNLWFAEYSPFSDGKVGRITPSGTITEFAIPGSNNRPSYITAGPDGNLWFTESGSNKIGRVTITGSFAEVTVPTASSFPQGICLGPDGNIWFTEYFSVGNKIGRVSLGLLYYTLTSCRVLDTRGVTSPLGGPALGANEIRTFPFAGACGLPSDALTVSANVTAVAPSAAGDLRVYRADNPTVVPGVMAFNAGRTRANNVLVAVSLDGTQSVTIQNNSLGTADVVLDVNGYFK